MQMSIAADEEVRFSGNVTKINKSSWGGVKKRRVQLTCLSPYAVYSQRLA
jgi:hypothetical protein